jgi:hypothetical protein
MNKQVVMPSIVGTTRASFRKHPICAKSIRLISCMHNQADGNLSTTLLTAVHDNLSTTLLKLEGEVDDKLHY